jgi:hypothetical protein
MLPVTCLPVPAPYFSTLSQTKSLFSGIICLGHEMRVLIFSITVAHDILILGIQRDIIINLHKSLCKLPVILVRF